MNPRSSAHFTLTKGIDLDERFANAPTNWRVAGAGVMEVTNRWQCDPRWTFCSLQNDLDKPYKGKAAVIWNKYKFPGDVSVDFFFSTKMDNRRGNPYGYGRDMNITIGSDGSDLRKGITFSFGGQNNTLSSISRDGNILDQLPVRIPTTMDYSRHWFHVQVERLSGTLRFKVDHFFQNEKYRRGEWIVSDPRPLTGDRIALWTYDNAVMLSRVRISGESTGTEVPGLADTRVTTVYDRE